MSEPFLGEIRLVGFNFAPHGWAMCNGQLLPISQNTALFALIGTFYGGDGIQTFALPDLRSRLPIHQGQGPGLSPYNIGGQYGSENVSLNVGQLPPHTHSMQCNTAGGNQAGPANNIPAVESTGTSLDYSNAAPNAAMNPLTIGPAGSGFPVPIIQPLLCMNYVIALQGIFPSRN